MQECWVWSQKPCLKKKKVSQGAMKGKSIQNYSHSAQVTGLWNSPKNQAGPPTPWAGASSPKSWQGPEAVRIVDCTRPGPGWTKTLDTISSGSSRKGFLEAVSKNRRPGEGEGRKDLGAGVQRGWWFQVLLHGMGGFPLPATDLLAPGNLWVEVREALGR